MPGYYPYPYNANGSVSPYAQGYPQGTGIGYPPQGSNPYGNVGPQIGMTNPVSNAPTAPPASAPPYYYPYGPQGTPQAAYYPPNSMMQQARPAAGYYYGPQGLQQGYPPGA